MSGTEVSDDLLRFWRDKSNALPRLSYCTEHTLCCTGNEYIAREYFFLAAEATLSTSRIRRTQINPDTVDGLLFLHGL